MMIPPLDWEYIKKEGGNAMGMLTGQAYDHVPSNPFVIGGAAVLHGHTINEFYTQPAKGCEWLVNASRVYEYAPMYMWIYATYWCEDYGGELKWPVGRMSAPGVIKHPAPTPELAENLEVLTPEEMTKGPTMTRHWEALSTLEKMLGPAFGPYSFVYEMFVVGSYWVGPENLFMWVHQEPELVKKLMRKVVEHSQIANELVVKKYGKSMVICASLLANSSTMSPQQCREFNIVYLKDMLEKSIKAGAGPVLYHLCGDHGQDYQLHEDCPTPQGTIMHVAYDGQKPADLNEVAKIFGNRCCLLGNTDTALMQRGTPAQVYENAKKDVLAYKHIKKGFMAGCACECPPFAPQANVQAWMRANKDFGSMKD